MKNEELQKYIDDIRKVAKSALDKQIYLPVKCDYDYELEEYTGSIISNYNIQEFVLEHIGKEYGSVYGDSHFKLKGSYRKEEVGVSLFCDKENARLALENKKYEILQETKVLLDTFNKLEELQKKTIDNTVFCVLQDNKTEKYQVVVMEVYNIMVSCTNYHYEKLIDDMSELKLNGSIVACELRDEIGHYTAVFGQRCFTDSNEAFEKAKRLNRELKEQ